MSADPLLRLGGRAGREDGSDPAAQTDREQGVYHPLGQDAQDGQMPLQRRRNTIDCADMAAVSASLEEADGSPALAEPRPTP
jgi:hypothetical protein